MNRKEKEIMSNVEQEIEKILESYLFERMNMKTFKDIEEDLESITHNGMQYSVKKPTFIVDKNIRGKLSVCGEIFNNTLNEIHGKLDVSIQPEDITNNSK